MGMTDRPELTDLLARFKSVLAEILTARSYAMETEVDGTTALFDDIEYDLLILDMGFLDPRNTPVLQQLASFSETTRRSPLRQSPLLILTGWDHAGKLVVKIFDEPNPKQLLALFQCLLRPAGTNATRLLEWGGLQLDPQDYRVLYHSNPIKLTPKEYELLELFLRNDRQVYSCSSILENLWNRHDAPSEEAVRTHIKGLRRKLTAAGLPPDFVETVYGFGYRLKSLSAPDPQKIIKSRC